MKNILILMTGGTIASVSTKQGLVPDNQNTLLHFDYQKEKAGRYPQKGCEKEPLQVSFKELFNLDSSNMTPKEWLFLAKELKQAICSGRYDGIVVTHGTDTMAYTMAGVSYLLAQMLGQIPVPVVFTGSQLPMEAEDTDAVRNLTDAVTTAACGVPGMVLVFAGRIIDALYAKKIYAKQMQAFESMHIQEAGYFDSQGRIIWNHKPVGVPDMTDLRNAAGQDFYQTSSYQVPPCIRLIPGMDGTLMELLVESGCRALILEVFGCGGIPESLLGAVSRAVEKHTAVFVISQCIQDDTDLSVYEVGTRAGLAGVIPAQGLTVEALSAWIICESVKSDFLP